MSGQEYKDDSVSYPKLLSVNRLSNMSSDYQGTSQEG